ncbi:MAG TPA: type III PLP-dependent enzyme [Azospirillaceae bacterium]|nr:type III PLP-dependent enzyme [Azospirillaceae bacterium]
MVTVFDTPFPDAAAMVATLTPEEPVYCLRPEVLRAQARAFVRGFPGKALYAVKCNAEPAVLDQLHAGGIRHFDTASLAEIALVKDRYVGARAYFMHPVKPRYAIREAHARWNVRHFAVDHPDEMAKIRFETAGAPDVVQVVRLATARGNAVYDLGGKFGCGVAEAARLVEEAVRGGQRVGLTFHVGSQCLNPAAYTAALELVRQVRTLAPLPLDVIDLGGGFPAAYVGVEPPPLEDYLSAIRAGLARLDLTDDTELWCEPGRALAAAGMSLVVRVDLRRDRQLYINDGVFGSLSDLRTPGFEFPMHGIRAGRVMAGPREPFTLFGPTCDPADAMHGPFLLPADIGEGDWIEIGQAGAYTAALRTRFNGFHPDRIVPVADGPLLPTADMMLDPIHAKAQAAE